MIIIQLGKYFRIKKSNKDKMIVLTDADSWTDFFYYFTNEELKDAFDFCLNTKSKQCLVLAYDLEYSKLRDQGRQVEHEDFNIRLENIIQRRKENKSYYETEKGK